MANSLTGQNQQLVWSNFLAPAPANPPGNQVAFTSASYSISAFRFVQAYASIGISMPSALNDLGWVIDNLRITVTLNRARMWAVTDARTPALLAHEQGHYDIVALTMSDLFVDLTSFPTVLLTQQAVQQYASARIAEARRRIDAMSNTAAGDGLYDRQTNHGLNPTPQASWSAAFVLARPPTGARFDLALQWHGITV